MRTARAAQQGAIDAKRMMDRAHYANNCIFAYYRLHPIKLSGRVKNPIKTPKHKEMLQKIAPWLPKHVPKWMLP